MATLANLAIGEEAIIEELRGARPMVRRLMELGLLPGTKVKLARRAPLGDPLEIRLRGYSLSIRRREAELVSLYRKVAEGAE